MFHAPVRADVFAALRAMKGLMVQEGLTTSDALKLMEEGQKAPDRPAPMMPPKLLGTCNTLYLNVSM